VHAVRAGVLGARPRLLDDGVTAAGLDQQRWQAGEVGL
jgi:hypothetical protein